MSNKKNNEEIAFKLLAHACNIRESFLHEAFDHYNDYKVWEKKRVGKKPMLIKEPCDELKIFQQSLLAFLYRLKNRTEYCSNSRFINKESLELIYPKILKHNLDTWLHGQIPGNSLYSAGVVHTNTKHSFMIKMDLKNAYYSVPQSELYRVLYGIFFDEIKSYYEAYKALPNSVQAHKRKMFKKFKTNFSSIKSEFLYQTRNIYREEYILDEDHFRKTGEFIYSKIVRIPHNRMLWISELYRILGDLGYSSISGNIFYQAFWEDSSDFKSSFMGRKPDSSYLYHPWPFFPKHRFPEFRRMIRDLVKKDIPLEGSDVDEIIKIFTENIVMLTTFEESLPKGAPTSGFLLNLVISESGFLNTILKHHERCSVWVDDIIITTHRKPDQDRIDDLIQKIEASGIFKHNPKKVKIYDLRNMSGSILGMKLNLRPLTEKEVGWRTDWPDKKITRGYRRSVEKGHEWKETRLILSKQKQKQYRAFLHRVTVNDCSDEDRDLALGYYGHIVSVYTWWNWNFPSSLFKVVNAFREKFIKPKGYTENKYRKKKKITKPVG